MWCRSLKYCTSAATINNNSNLSYLISPQVALLSSLPMSSNLPTVTKAIVIQESKVPQNPLYHDANLIKRPLLAPKPDEVVVKMGAVGFNHKDVSNSSDLPCAFTIKLAYFLRQLWLRQGQYPGINIGAVFGGDGAGQFAFFKPTFLSLAVTISGTVIASGTPNDPLLNKRVFLTPSRGWEKDSQGPESR